MYRYNIPCPESRTFDTASIAVEYIESIPQGSIVVKADGLAAGKGVTIPTAMKRRYRRSQMRWNAERSAMPVKPS